MGTCFFPSITEARGMDLADDAEIYLIDSSDFSGTVNAAAKEALDTWVNSDEIRLSGID